MAIGLVGKKCGMTRVFNPDGAAIPVTVIEVLPNRITQIKTLEREKYQAIQVTMGERKNSRINKPLKGFYAKNGVKPGKGLWEFSFDEGDKPKEVEFKIGAELKIGLFEEGQFVDVVGISKGKGFAGVIKRHNFSSQDATHGNSLSHRAPGSIGQRQSPGKVFKGKKMAGRMGGERVTTQNLKVVRIDQERNLLLVSGAVPGKPGGVICVLPANKKCKSLKGE